MSPTQKRQPKVSFKPVKHQPRFVPPLPKPESESDYEYSYSEYSSEEDSVEAHARQPRSVSRQVATRSLPPIDWDQKSDGAIGFKQLAPVLSTKPNTPGAPLTHPLWQKIILECAAHLAGIMLALYMPAAYIPLSGWFSKFALYNTGWAIARFVGTHLSIHPERYTAWSGVLLGQTAIATASMGLYDKSASLLEKMRCKI